MKTSLPILLGLALCGCASSAHYSPSETAIQSSAEAAKTMYWQQQQPHPADASPRYRRLTITIPAHVEGGVQYEEQTRTILIAE